MSATTIALLPFENLSGDPSQDVIARGLSLDLAVELSRFTTLEVTPPASASQVLTLAAGPHHGWPDRHVDRRTGMGRPL
jgi:TolB-like protein